MAKVAVGLGSNLGDRSAHLTLAANRLAQLGSGLRLSPVYETRPMYVDDQPPYLNAVATLESERGPLDLLRRLKAIESEIGRKTRQRYGPREIDLDLLSFGSARYAFVDKGKTVLEVPHPKTVERRFVLRPLFDLEPDLRLPSLGSVREMLEATEDQAADVLPFEDAVLSI